MPFPGHGRPNRPAGQLGRSGLLLPLLLVLTACSSGADAAGGGPPSQPAAGPTTASGSSAPPTSSADAEAAVVGMWITADGEIRQELLPGGRYEEARGDRERAYTGRYWVTADHIEYLDDTGFTATGDFRDGVLHHGGMEFFRDGDPRITAR